MPYNSVTISQSELAFKHKPYDERHIRQTLPKKGGRNPRAPPLDPPLLIDKYKEITGFDVYSARGGTPYIGLYREALPERDTFYMLEVYKRVGISQDEVYKG